MREFMRVGTKLMQGNWDSFFVTFYSRSYCGEEFPFEDPYSPPLDLFEIRTKLYLGFLVLFTPLYHTIIYHFVDLSVCTY